MTEQAFIGMLRYSAENPKGTVGVLPRLPIRRKMGVNLLTFAGLGTGSLPI